MPSQQFRHPARGVIAAVLNYLSNATALAWIRRAILSRLPAVVLESDVRDVLYVTWMVDIALAQRLAPPGAILLEHQGKTPFTILSYRHGGFGPACLGMLRRWCFPSPLQSNWRLYLAEPMPGGDPVATVIFVKNVLDSTLYAVGTRIFSDALQAHLAHRFVLSNTARDFRVEIDPGAGSAPRLRLHAQSSVSTHLPRCFSGLYSNWEAAVMDLCRQEAALCEIPGGNHIALARIDLPIDVHQVQPYQLLTGTECPLLATLNPDAEALCFVLPQVRFQVLSERLLNTDLR